MNRRYLHVTAIAVLAFASLAPAQLDLPRPSPKATVSQVVGLTDVTIAYCRPGVKERPIWGVLVPYDQVWRTGANEATTITFSTDVKVDGKPLAAGTYGLFTVPGKEAWEFVFNKGATQWGAYEYKQAEDVLRLKVRPREVPFTERMTFSFPDTTPDSTQVELAWEKLAVAFTVKVDMVGRVLGDARKAMAELKADDWRTPARAAAFCADNDVNPDEAMAWVDRSIGMSPTYFNHFTKARLLAAKGKTTEAIALAKKAIELGKAAQPPSDTAPAERALAGWTK